MSKTLATVLAVSGLLATFAWSAFASIPAPALESVRVASFSHESREYRPIDLSGTGELPAQTTRPLTIVARRPAAKPEIPNVWRCSAPRKLDNDATQTVKECATK
jgi:hypothetical protein